MRPTNFRWCSGICSASRVIRSAPPSSRWGRCCCLAHPGPQRRAGRHSQHRVPLCRRRFGKSDAQSKGLIDLKDLREVLSYISSSDERQGDQRSRYGNVSAASVGAVQRQLLVLENQGGAKFFGEPALDIDDLMRTDRDGRGIINILAADKLMASPRLYATFLLWLLSELFEKLPEVGDPPKPKLVFFFDEAHLLVQRCAEGAARQDRAGGAPDPLQGRRRLFRHAKSARRAGQGARAARQPRPARAARLHAARPEGGAGGGRNVPPESRSSIPRRSSPSSARARRWCRSSKATARRRWSNAR